MKEEEIDLDISKYSIADIEYFLGLDAMAHYSETDILEKSSEIRDQLLNGGNFNSQFKRNFIEFINTAQKRLVDVKIRPNKPAPTTISKNTVSDIIIQNFTDPFSSRENEIISRPETQFIQSQPSEYYPGQLNPLNNRVIIKCLTIDSRFRDNISSTKSSDFIVQLPLKLSKVVSMQLSSIEFPISFYGISASYGNNFLNISLDYVSPPDITSIITETRIYTIPDGNYNSTDLINALNNLLQGNDDAADNFKNIKFSVDLNSNSSGTGKVTIAVVTNTENIRNLGLSFSTDSEGDSNVTTPLTSRFGSNMGFINPSYTGSLSYTSESVMEPFGIRYFYLVVDDYNNSVNNHFVTAFNRSILNPNTLARIAVSGNYFSVLTTNDLKVVTEPREYFGPVDIQRLHIRIFDEYGRILDMNNTNFSFCLTFKLLYNL
jgi:hypothetical protein